MRPSHLDHRMGIAPYKRTDQENRYSPDPYQSRWILPNDAPIGKISRCAGINNCSGRRQKRISLSEQQPPPLDSESFKDEIDQITNAQEIDLILNALGCRFTGRSLALLAPYGRIVTLLEEPLAPEDTVHSKKKNLTLHWVQALTPNILNINSLQKAQTKIFKLGQALADEGKFSIRISQSFQLEHVAEAMDLIESGHPFGRIVLSMAVKEDFVWQHT